MDINRFLEDACGRDERKQPKVVLTAILSMVNPDTNKSNPLLSRAMLKPALNVVRNGNFIELFFEFITDTDIDYSMLQKIFLRYEEEIAKYTDGDPMVPALYIALNAIEHGEKYTLSCLNPIMWGTQPLINGGKNLVIKAVYELGNIGLFEADGKEDKKKEIKEENKAAK